MTVGQNVFALFIGVDSSGLNDKRVYEQITRKTMRLLALHFIFAEVHSVLTDNVMNAERHTLVLLCHLNQQPPCWHQDSMLCFEHL